MEDKPDGRRWSGYAEAASHRQAGQDRTPPMMKRLLPFAVAAVLLPYCGTVMAQAKPLAGAIASHPDRPNAKPTDVDSVDHIVAAVYDVISGPAHQPRDWNRMRSLFVPDARLVPVRVTVGSPNDVIFLSIDDYIARSSARMETDGFVERGIRQPRQHIFNLRVAPRCVRQDAVCPRHQLDSAAEGWRAVLDRADLLGC